MCIDTHTHQQKANSILNIYPKDSVPNQSFSIGIHPWHLDELELQKEYLIEKSKHKNCLAIGEFGFDRKCGTDLTLQNEMLDFQMELAIKLEKPIIIHCVKAFDLLIPKIAKVATPVIIHGFNQNEEILRQLKQVDNLYFSFGHALLKQNSNAQKALKTVSLSKVFFETDDKNDLHIEDIYVKASELLNLQLKLLEKQINTNFQKVFI